MPNLLNSYRMGGAPWLVEGVTFPNPDSGLVRGAGLTGAADSKLLSFAIWVRVITFPNPGRGIIVPSTSVGGAPSPHLYVRTDVSPNGFAAQCKGVSTTTVLNMRTVNAMSTNTWYCLMGAVDMADLSKARLYVGDADEFSQSAYTNEAIDFTYADWAVAENPDLSGELDCELGPIWYAPGQWLDFAVQDERRKFFSPNGKPVDPGADGSTPTGVAPLMAHWVIDGAAASSFATNRGTGGDSTTPAALGVASTSPSD